jgi:hypothetical protein
MAIKNFINIINIKENKTMEKLNTALNHINEAYDIMSAAGSPIEALWNEIENIPDDELVNVSAGTLKNLMRQHMAYGAYIMGNMDGVRQYLQMKNLI